MEKMNPEIMQLVEDYSMMRTHRKSREALDAGSDCFGYEFEPLDAFSTDPLGFTERTMRLHTEAMEMFLFFRKLNRHSPLFVKMSGRFEKLVRVLGSCCITKAVMEQQGETFRMLNSLTIEYLRGMTAFALRKCHAAFLETRNAGRFGHTLLEMSVRWAALDIRLEATAEKIGQIKAGKITVSLPEKAPSAGARKEPAGDTERPAAALPVQGIALSIDKAAAGKADGPRPEENTAPQQPRASQAKASEPEFSQSPEADPAETPEEREEKFKRHVLMQDAVDRADREAFGAVYQARGPALESLWYSFLERDEADGFAALKSMGIVVETADPPPEEEPVSAEVYQPETA